MAVANQNLKYLRKLRGWTQEEFAQKIGIKRSLVGAYEEERAEPNYDVLETVSDLFKVSIDDLLRKDLSETKGSYLAKRRQLKMMAETNVIHFVPVKAAAGYLNGYADPEYFEKLPLMNLPFRIIGKHRAFPIKGDSMPPLRDGCFVVGKFIESLKDIQNGHTYVLLTREDGVVYKRVYNKGSIFELHSDNKHYSPYTVKASDILEVWEFVCTLNISDKPSEELNLDSIIHMLNSMRVEMEKK